MKKWLIVAASMVAAGCILFGGVLVMMSLSGCNMFSTVTYETNRHEISEDFEHISVKCDTTDLTILPSEDGTCAVVCREQAKLKHQVSVRDGTLCIEKVDTRKWYEHIEISFDTEGPTVTVYLPKEAYGKLTVRTSTGNTELAAGVGFTDMDIAQSTGDVVSRASVSGLMKIKTSTGDIRVENLTAGSLDLSVTTGKVTVSDVVCEGNVTVGVDTGDSMLTNVACKNLTSTGDTGRLILTRVVAAEAFSIERDTGDVRFDACDASEMTVKTSTGRVSGTLLSEKVFVTRSSTGDISVPESLTGGKCKITTSTGDIRISITKGE